MICADVLFMSMVDGSDKNFVKRSVDLNVRVCEMRNHKMMFQQKCTPYTPSLHVLHMLDVLDIFLWVQKPHTTSPSLTYNRIIQKMNVP